MQNPTSAAMRGTADIITVYPIAEHAAG